MDAPCVAPSRVTQKIFAVLVEWYHRIVLTMSFKLVSFLHLSELKTANQSRTALVTTITSSTPPSSTGRPRTSNITVSCMSWSCSCSISLACTYSLRRSLFQLAAFVTVGCNDQMYVPSKLEFFTRACCRRLSFLSVVSSWHSNTNSRIHWFTDVLLLWFYTVLCFALHVCILCVYCVLTLFYKLLINLYCIVF